MRATILLTAVLLSACNEAPIDQPFSTHERYSALLDSTGADGTLLGRSWLEAGRIALLEPVPVTLPYAEAGAFLAHEAVANGYAFAGVEGLRLRVELATAGPEANVPAGNVYVELFRVERRGEDSRHTRIAALPPEQPVLEVELPAEGTYVLRLQPELLADLRFRLAIEAEAVLPFPVSGLGTGAVQSFFGAERDAGARQHEGVDIFAPRLTPVIAVADGRATPRRNRLGGNTVWLTVAGASYYYAHLERAAFESARRVRAGDVLGYVGNSGNAATAPPHLHFGVYRWGRGAVDPLPLLGARHFDAELAPALFEPRYGETLADTLHLRRAPSRTSDSVALLPAGTLVRSSAASGEWLRVNVPGSDGQRGWIHARYERRLDTAERRWQAPAPLFLHGRPRAAEPVVDYVEAGTVLEVLAERDDHLLLRNSATSRVGWAPGAADS